MTILNPYLSFRDDAREAMTFYQQALGGELRIFSFGDYPGMADPSENDLVMHAQLTTADGMVLMGSDTPSSMSHQPAQGMSVSLAGDDESALRAVWDRLSEGATITLPFGPAPWGDQFGMLVDRFGTPWMFSAGQSPA
ncbi:VOC family protein [uncultured Microbacterium sp.]|uniref:VOC family protein n=1 Tax=uncultured Microbacterium sp. TaxID=191216 RepID=UPI002600C369|nr:VOC family protein [uncultured Microbacterium sp.]